MANYEQRPHQGVLFMNSNKKAQTHPDFSGTYTDANGVKWNIAAWKKQSAKGEYYSISTSEIIPK